VGQSGQCHMMEVGGQQGYLRSEGPSFLEQKKLISSYLLGSVSRRSCSTKRVITSAQDLLNMQAFGMSQLLVIDNVESRSIRRGANCDCYSAQEQAGMQDITHTSGHKSSH
jgi:hypothetical protein